MRWAIETFKELMKGYKPEAHLDLLFDSLCNSTNFESKKIKEISEESIKDFKDKSSENISILLEKKSNSDLYPSRLLNLGIYLIFTHSSDFMEAEESKKNKILENIFTKLNLSVTKAEKDIGIYKSSITKLEQAKELLEELKIKDKKKTK